MYYLMRMRETVNVQTPGVNVLTLTGFTYRGRGLAPHKFTPMPGVHNLIQPTGNQAGVFLIQPEARRLIRVVVRI